MSNDANSQERDERWEPVWQGDGEADAAIICGSLEAAGFRAQAQGARPVGSALPHAFLRDSWAVFVPSRDALGARDLLERSGEGANLVDDQIDDGFNATRRETLRFVLVGLLVLAGMIVWFEIQTRMQ